jgi:hypothetical protein
VQSKAKRAHSLVELMIASALAGICMLGILALMKAGNRYLLVTQAKADLQHDALSLVHKLILEFSETNDTTFAVGNAACSSCQAEHGHPHPGNGSLHKGVVFASPRSALTGKVEYDDVGRMLWQKYVCYYERPVDGLPCVVREACNLPDTPAFPPSPPSLDDFLTVNYDRRIMARNCTLFECFQSATNLEVHIRMEMPSGFGRKYGFEFKTQVFARN